MNIRVKRNSLLLITWLVIVFLLELDFMGIIIMPSFWYSLNSTGHKTIIIIISIMVSLYYLKSRGKQIRAIQTRYNVVFFVMIFFVSIFTIIYYSNQTLFQTYRVWEHLLCISMITPTMMLLSQKDGLRTFFRILGVIVFIYMLLICIQAILYNYNHTVFMSSYFAQRTIGSRNNRVRLSIDYFIYILLIFDFDKVLNQSSYSKKEKAFSVIRLILGIYIMLFVQGSRAYLASLICGCLSVAFFSRQNKNILFRNVFIVLMLVIFCVSTGVLDGFIDSIFSTAGDYNYSRINRLAAVGYYWEKFMSNPLFGIGFLSDANNIYLSILKGNSGTYYLTDVGIIGVVAQMGMFGLVSYFYIIWRGYKATKFLAKTGELNNYGFVCGVFVFLIMSSFSLSIFDNFRVFSLPICISLFESVLLTSEKRMKTKRIIS